MSKEMPIPDSALVDLIIQDRESNPDYSRSRSMSEYNFYLGNFFLTSLASDYLKRNGSFKWYDMCCGRFEAGKNFLEYFGTSQGKIEARGIDLITETPEDQISHHESLIISRGNVVNYPIPPDVDLITTVDGLYLVNQLLGFEQYCATIEHWYNSLSIGGTLLMMRDLAMTGYERPINIERSLTRQLGDAVEISKPEERGHPEFRNFIKIIKQSPDPIRIS